MTNIIKQVINVGSQSNDGTGDSIRDAFTKVNTNFDILYAVAGIGNGLLFTALQDGPSALNPQNVIVTDPTGLTITQMSLVGLDGIQIGLNYNTNPATLTIASTLTSLASDPLPTIQSGADLSGNGTARAINFADPKRDTDLVTKEWVENNFLNRDGVFQYDTGIGALASTSTIVEGSTLRHNIVLDPIAVQTSTNIGKVISFLNSTGTTSTINLAYQAWKPSHLTRKDYVDTKISLQGISTIDSNTGEVNPGFGQMTGALQLFRDPVETDDPLTAATKNYVDSTGFPSKSNFFVALNGNDNRTDIPTFKRGRSWAWAFRSINKAAQAAEAYQNSSQIVLGPYVKTITTDNFTSPCNITQITSSSIPNAIKLVVPYDGSSGTDPFINTSIYPGIYLIGMDTGATAEILNVVSGGGTEYYEVVPVDYAVGFPTSITALGQTGTVTINFNEQNLVAVPDFWEDYTFVLDNSVGGGQGTIIGSNTTYDEQGNVFDQLIVRVTKPFGQKNVSIPGSAWHVYAGDWTDPSASTGGFSLGESLKYGQAYNRTEVSIKVESGEYDEDLPIRLADNVSIVGDEFRRSMVRPGKWPATYRHLRSTSAYANLYFRRDTQVDGLVIVDLITGTNYASAVAITPDGVTNSSLTGVVNFTLNTGTANPSWKDKVFVGAGGKGVITQTNANVFSVNLAENANGVRAINSNTTISTGSWAIYAPINFGYHYLKDPTRPMNLLGWEPGGALSNPGGYNVASATLLKNKEFIQEEVIRYLDATYSNGFVYNRAKCKRDVAYFVEGLAYDLQTGGVSRTINLPEAYFVSSDTYVYTQELPQLTTAITYIGALASQVMSNTSVTNYQSTVTQVFADVSLEPDAATKVVQLATTINTILNNSDATYNPGKFNNQIDIFLMNDATMIRYLAGQGHGGFMKVLDPYGQIKAKSPYTQTASSFSESIGRHRFAGGFFVDGFTGNMQLTTTASSAGTNSAGDYVTIPVQGYALKLRKPLTPCFFISNGIQYQIDYISNWNPTANTDYGTATLNLDPNKYGGIESINLSGTLNTFKPNSQFSVTVSSPGTPGGLTARAYATTDGSGVITGITVTYSGNGYVRATDPGYSAVNNAITYTLGGAVLTPTIVQGSITAITVSNPGSGYTTNTPINISAPTTVGGVTARATITGVNATGGITSVAVTNGYNGSGYTIAPKITFGNSNITYTTVIRKGFIGTLPSNIETITAGNRSMLANDFTQLNDYAYGIFATNGGFIENVSMFTYYCWTSYYALNGAQLRTITGSSAYGTYGLIAEGSDPNEIPIAISLPDELSQVVSIYNQAPYTNVIGGTSLYFVLGGAISFIPFDQSLLEINHKGIRKTYSVKGATFVTTATGNTYVYSLAIDTSVSSGGLYAAVPDGTSAVIRTGNQFRLSGVNAATITRPSTVLSVSEDPTDVYRILTYTSLGNDVALAEADQLYDYMTIQPYRQNDQYRQGVTNPIVTGGGNGYSGSTATITFSAPSPATVTASVNGDQGTSSSPVQSFLISGQTSIIHPGMSVSGTGIIAGTYVIWSSSATNTVAFNQSQYLSGGVTLTFSGVTAAGYATVSGGSVNGVVITEPGVGYNTPPTVTASTPGGGSSATIVVSLAGIVGSNYIKVVDVGAQSYARLQLAQSSGYVYRFGYDGRIYNITNYAPPSTTTPWGQLTVSTYSTGTGLVSEITADPLYAGVQANTTGSITVRISTLRATSHDMVNVGTGGYATTRIPNDLYGPPLINPQQSQEVIEKAKGRVYYVTADQDGNFRVGKYFRVDQGRGTVTINAPISLSGVNSLSFKKGVEVNEFSIDQTMAAESNSKVPTEQTIVGYLNARLGVTRTGALYNGTGASIGPGYLPLTGTPGIPMRGSIDMGFVGNITNLPPPTGQSYAANKDYADSKISLAGQNEAQANGGQLAGKMTGPLALVGDPSTTTTVVSVTANSGATLLYCNTSTLYVGMRLNNVAATTGTVINSFGPGYAVLNQGLASSISNGTTLTFDPILQSATKQYVDSNSQISKLRDVVLTSPTNQDLLMFTTVATPSLNQPVSFYNTATILVNVTNNTSNPSNTSSTIGGGSDVAFTRSGNSLTIKLTGGTLGGANNPITDYHVNAAAQIQQSKLLMTVAGTSASSPTGTQQQIQANLGLSQYNNKIFSLTNGWVTLASATSTSNGIPATALQWIPGSSTGGLLGSVALGNADAAVTALSSATVRTWLNVGSLSSGGTFSGPVTFTGGVTVQTTNMDVQSTLNTHNILPDATNTYKIGDVGNVYNSMYASTFFGALNGSGASISANTIPNSSLVNNSVTVSAGTGMSGGGTVALGSSVTLTNNGVVGLSAGTAITISGSPGGTFTVNNNGVTSLSAGTGVSVSNNAGGSSSVSIGQSVGTGDSPTFASLTSNGIIEQVNSSVNAYRMRGASAGALSFYDGKDPDASVYNYTLNLDGGSFGFYFSTVNSPYDIGTQQASIDSSGVVHGTATAARYADLAEKYSADREYEQGTVLVFGGDKEVTESQTANDKRVAGVVSTNPAHLMNDQLEGGIAVALTGRVPTKVVGTIKKGDLMVTSNIPGVAMANDDPKIGTIIGKALEDYDSSEVGVIEVVVGRV